MPLLRILALACAVVVMGSAATAQSVTRAAGVRLHHLHFRTGDIAAAMGNTVRTYGGTRTVVQGLGAGVRVVDTYLLFELQDDAPPDPPGRPVPSACQRVHRRREVAWRARRRRHGLGRGSKILLGIPADLTLDHIGLRPPISMA